MSRRKIKPGDIYLFTSKGGSKTYWLVLEKPIKYYNLSRSIRLWTDIVADNTEEYPQEANILIDDKAEWTYVC